MVLSFFTTKKNVTTVTAVTIVTIVTTVTTVLTVTTVTTVTTTVAFRLSQSIGSCLRFNWLHLTGERQQFIDTVGNPLSQCRSLGTYTLLRVKCGSLGTYTLTAD